MIEIQVECPRCKEMRTIATIEGDGTRYSYCSPCLEIFNKASTRLERDAKVKCDHKWYQSGSLRGLVCSKCQDIKVG